MIFDLAIGEKEGNGGDLSQLGNDLAVVYGMENWFYLAMFGGNKEASTTNTPVADAKDYWGNNLLMPNDFSIQFNSETERALDKTALTSAGRVVIENAIKADLQFLKPQSTFTVDVQIVATDRINVTIKIITNITEQKIIIIDFKKTADGDWFISDFNEDFL